MAAASPADMAPAVPAPAPAAAEATPASATAASSSSSSAAATAAAAAAAVPPPLSGTASLTKLMIDKSLSMLSSHKVVTSRGIGMLQRNLYGILFGPMFSQSWENALAREEQKTGKNGMQKTNEASLKRLSVFFNNKKVRAQSGASIAVALCNPTAARESFEHRFTLIWLGGGAPAAAAAAGSSSPSPRLFKIDGMKRSGILGYTTEQTSWPVLCTEVSDPARLWAALQAFIPPSNPKQEFDKERAAAWDVIVAQEPTATAAPASAAAAAPAGSVLSRNVSFGSRIDAKGPQSILVVTNDEEGLAVDLKNGLVERLKAISLQLDAMAQ